MNEDEEFSIMLPVTKNGRELYMKLIEFAKKRGKMLKKDVNVYLIKLGVVEDESSHEFEIFAFMEDTGKDKKIILQNHAIVAQMLYSTLRIVPTIRGVYKFTTIPKEKINRKIQWQYRMYG